MEDSDLSGIDPRGFIQKDILFIKQRLPRFGYQPGDSLEDVAYRQGFHDLLLFIEQSVIGRKSDHGSQAQAKEKGKGRR
jgi:hypothetical protein